MGRSVDRRQTELERILRREDTARELPQVLVARSERSDAIHVKRELAAHAVVTTVTTRERLHAELAQLRWRKPLRNYAVLIIDAELASEDGFSLDALDDVDSRADVLVVNTLNLPVVHDVRGRLGGRVVPPVALLRAVREALAN